MDLDLKDRSVDVQRPRVRVRQHNVPGGTAAGVVQQNIYPLHFTFPGLGPKPLEVESQRTVGVNLSAVGGGHGFIVLVGRDLLANCVFIYNGPQGMFTLAW